MENINEQEVLEVKPKHRKKEVNSRKVIKILITSVVEIAILSLGFGIGYYYAKKTLPFGQITTDYVSYEEILKIYKPTSEENKKNIDSLINEKSYYTIFKKSYYNLLMKDKVNIVTTGYTDSTGIRVNINNIKKLEKKFFYMHTISKGNSSFLSSMTDNNIEAAFDISSKLVKLKEKNDKQFTEMTELKYVNSYGLVQYAMCNYNITETTILNGSIVKEGENYKLIINLDPVKSTKNLIVQMNKMSGSNSTYSGGNVEYSMLLTSDFNIISVSVNEKYTAKGLPCTSYTEDIYYYSGDENYEGLKENERYNAL